MKSQTAWFSLFVGLTAFGAAYAAPNALTTAPWQQNVYTNRFTIFCETAEVVPGLSLQYGSGYGQSVEMSCVPGDSDGETQHYIYKGRANFDSVSGVIGSLVSYRIVADGAVLKCPDGSDAAGSVWVWKDVPNERLSVALWSDNQVGAKVGDYDYDRFAYIKAAFGRMVAHDVDFGISTGDMTTSGSYADQTRPCVLDGSGILGRTRPYYVCFGNHDDYVAPDEMNKRYFETGSLDEPAYGTSERGAYYFYRGNVLFIFLHWPHDNQQGDYSVYRTWLQDLLATPRAKQAKFRLLFSHKPMFLEVWSEGSEGRNYDTSLYDTAVAGGVDMVVSGHMHGYERTVTDKGLVQLVNGGMGSLDHKEHVVNNYGDWTKMGGHRNIPYLWARQSAWKKPTLCGYFPVNMGCITSYCEMKIDGGELNVQAHGFCANGDYIGVFDDFTLVSKTDRTPPTPRRAVTAACSDPSSFDAFVNTPVTNAKWKEYKDAVDEDFTYATADASKPVVNVSKDEITRFCAWLNNGASGVSYRLPTETELRAKRTNLAGAVTEWTSTVDKETGWCRILGGNALASNTVWTATGDKPAIASSACHANYLGFRLVKESGTEVVVTIRDWTGRKVQTVRGVTTTGTFALDVADYFNATVDYVTAFDGGTVSAAPSSDVVSGSVVTWTGVDRRLETEVFVQPRVPYKNFAQYNMGDPWIVKDPAANVWYVTSTMANDGLSVRQTTTFPTNRFGSSRTYRLKDHSEFGNYKYYIWAPEIHCIQGRWYAYLSASSNSGSSNYERPFVLQLPDGLTPYSTQWEFGAKLVTPGGDRWAIDGTILDDTPNGGKLYYVWSGWPGTSNGTQNLYLAEMATPTSFASGAARIQISTPTESWETLTKSPCKVNEGPAVLRHGDAVHIVYSCNGCWTDDYSLALLTCTDGNFANPASWKKSSSRIFVSRPGAYGPGHCSFTRTADGQDMIVYHAKNVSGHSSDYYNYRDIRMQPIAWHGDTPVLGVPRPYDDTLTSDPLDLNADYYKEGPDVPPPPSPTDYGAPDTKAATYTWKGGEGPWEYTTQWTPGANATYGIPSHKTYATANFPASLAEATTCTLTSDRSVKNVYFDSPNLTFVIDNATLTVTSTLSSDTWGAYNFGNTAKGDPKIVFKGAAPGLYESTPDWRSNFGCLAGDATGLCTVRFEIPAANWAAAPIRTAATESKVCFWDNVKFEIDATALGVPAAGAPIVVPLAASSDGVFFMADSFDAVTNRSEIVCAAGATGRIVNGGNDLQLVVTAGAAPEPPAPEAYDVTLESLLDEMCDADAATRLAALPWTGRLWSSYDRASVSPADSSTWFANNDRSQFVRTMQVGDRTECVMVDAKGPGALTRLWTANGYGTVYRFYVDGASEPVVSGVGTNLIGGHVLCPAPLADEVSLLQPPAQRAQDLYLPITFAKSLVVTAELKDIPPDDDPGQTLRFWYNAEVRTYAEGTRVEPFSSAVLARAQDAIAAANAALRSPSAPVTDETQSLNGALAAGASRSVTFTRTGGAIRSFSLRLADGDEPLRTVRVKITFDGETTVDAAVGQLFGAGYAATPYATVNGGAAADGTLTLLQVMPFATSCTVTLENTGSSACTVSASSVAVGGYEWDAARSLHFGALGFEERALPTRRGAAGCYDLPWVKLEGQGHLVGNTLMLDNSQSDQWWGEGDEKIYIDGETFPSYFGTGTEDFFGYAWGHGKPFAAHPFLALPLAGEVLTGGRRLVTTVRTRRLDVVPFATSLKLDVEIWHWEDCAMDYAPATFWYARPGVSITPGGLTPSPPGTPVLTAPADFTPVPTLNEEILEFNALSSDVKSDVLLKEADNAAYRERLSAAYKTGLPAITLAWDGTEGRCEVKVWRECDGKLVLDTTSTTRTAVFWDAEIGRNYRWTVTCGESAATGYFYTESAGPRLINEQYGQVANVRDLGGWATADGLVVRQGVLFRTGSFGALTGIGAPYFTGTLGVRQDVDLRPEDAILAEDVTPYGGSVGVSPLGASVPRYCSDVAKGVAFLGNYADLFKNDGYQQAFWYNFVELNTELKLPAVFHCSAGRDRTGCIAYVIGAVLGVSADDLATDYYTSWASQGWIDRDTTAAHQAKWLPAFVNGLNAAYPPAQYPTLRQQAEKFLSDCCVKAGGTEAQAQAAIAALRARMLEIPEAPRTAGGKYAVPVPTIASKPANGSLQTADLVRSGFYAVSANAGGVAAGDYPVELTLNDPDNACWADGTEGATKTLIFTIRAGRIAGDRTWTGAAGDGRWLTAENWDPLESPAADEGATVTNAAGEIALDADVTLAKLKLERDAAVRFANAGGAARTFAVTAQSGNVLGQTDSTLEFSGAGLTATIGGGNNVYVKGAVVASDGAQLTLTGYDFDDNSGQVFRATGAGTVFNLDRTLTSNMNAGNYETRFEARDGATLQQSKSQKVPFASTSTSAPQHVYFTGDHGEWMGFSSVTFNGVGVVPHFDLNATPVQVGALSTHGDGVTATLKDGGAVKSGSTLKFSNGGKTATIDVDGWGGICTKGSSAALYLGGSTAGKLTVNLRFAPDAAEKYAADSNLKAVFTTATAGTSSKIYLYSGVAFNVDVANFASAKEGTWKLPLCYQAQTGSYGTKNLPAGDCLRLLNAGAQADRYTLACTAEGQYVYLTLVKTPGADPIPDEIANGKSGDPITIPAGATVDVSDPKRLIVDGVAYDAKEHYVFAKTETGGVMLAIDPEEAEIAGIVIAPDGMVTVASGKAFADFRYALEGADNLAFERSDLTSFRQLGEGRTISVEKDGDSRFYRLVVTDRQ